ncbi:MAG: hypothetical protein OHK0019_00810 [Saprospiraceae bacterium]
MTQGEQIFRQTLADNLRIIELTQRNKGLEAFLRKIQERLHPSILEDNVMTRLDPDLQEELETLLKRKK